MTETVVTERIYSAPPTVVFAAWTDVAILSTWFGCAADMLWTIHAWEPVVGGAIHVSLDFDGVPYVVRGEFLEVEAPHRLRYRWEHDQVVTVSIDPHDSGTLQRVEHAGLPNEQLGDVVTGGWSASVGQLAGAIA